MSPPLPMLYGILCEMTLSSCRSILEERDTVADDVVSRIAGVWRRGITVAVLVEAVSDEVDEKKRLQEDDCLRISWRRDY